MSARDRAKERAETEQMHVLGDIASERERQDAKWGEQDHEDGTGADCYVRDLDDAREDFEAAVVTGTLTWLDILKEEVLEAFAEPDEAKLEVELVQVAAVATAWVECIRRRRAKRMEVAK